MSYYYYQLPQAEELDDSMYTSGSLRHATNRGRQDNRPYRPRSSTDSIPFVDADSTCGHPRTGALSRDPATSSSEETVNRHPPHYQYDNRNPCAAPSARRRRRYPPPPPSPPATFLDSEDATSLNNLLDALDDLGVEEDRRSSLATTGSSRDGDEDAVSPLNGPPRPTLASILVSIPPPPTPPPPENEMTLEQRQELQQYQEQTRRVTTSFILPSPPPPPEDFQTKVTPIYNAFRK